MLAAPIAWAAHLCICYLLVTLDCQTNWNGMGWSVAIATVVLAAVAAAAGLVSWRGRPTVQDTDELSGAVRFVYRVGLVSSPVFVVAIVLAGVAPAFVARCA